MTARNLLLTISLLATGCSQSFRYYTPTTATEQSHCIRECGGEAECLQSCSGVIRSSGTCQALSQPGLVCEETSERPPNLGLRAALGVGAVGMVVGLFVVAMMASDFEVIDGPLIEPDIQLTPR